MTLGERLKAAREKKRYTQIEVAKKLGISNGAISGYERDYRDPDTETLLKLAELYDVSPNWLLNRSEKKEDAVVLPKSIYDEIIKEAENRYGVTLRDDPFVVDTIKQLVDNYAKTKRNQ
ncbi:helix-turn-helix transcriptional regulator [Cohnella lubricantis]|uniref:Helix-turn-helix transcriptional regulator n=1 Tax=Cohnella lubricantis TaxID=2163172 RepID=A0A841T6E6_9BACL|nr:helix-turn-helix transcriptional regulator [Cohnella lubricantis]MBB6676462.1 helix-turn-helix transcriptional regulator [Cohnella lubricantis]MBP2117078.1 transcriptional regulator with XRE-family HTH domain [Cohnella lubricantis]